MAKLTDSQLIVLSAAAARDDGLAVVPAKMNKAAASKVGSSLLARKLMREVKTKSGMPVWRENADGRSISLLITKAGRDAIGVEDDGDVAAATAATAEKRAVTDRASRTAAARKAAAPNLDASAPRAGSKQALMIGMLSANSGCALDALVEATGWLPHTTRAAMTGLRKRGFSIERTRAEGASSVYRIVASPASAAA